MDANSTPIFESRSSGILHFRPVSAIVIEFANPIHQDLLDNFILDGVAMSREQLAPIWRDASGAEVWERDVGRRG